MSTTALFSALFSIAPGTGACVYSLWFSYDWTKLQYQKVLKWCRDGTKVLRVPTESRISWFSPTDGPNFFFEKKIMGWSRLIRLFYGRPRTEFLIKHKILKRCYIFLLKNFLFRKASFSSFVGSIISAINSEHVYKAERRKAYNGLSTRSEFNESSDQ